MADTTYRLLLRVTLKLLTLSALIIVAYALLSGGEVEEEHASAKPTPRIALPALTPANPQRIETPSGPLQLLRMDNTGPLYLFYDRGGTLGCPLAWQAAGKQEAPQQPWPGGFRDQCGGTWYRYDGTVLPGQSATRNLEAPPYRLAEGNLLQLGVNGDNAAPATPAAD